MTLGNVGNGDEIVIAGGGIAGLTTALALSKFGFKSIVIEQEQFRDSVGTGIQLSPNATRVLLKFNLGESVLSHGMRPNHLVTRNWRSGRITSKSSLNLNTKSDASCPYLHIHRGELIEVLASAANLDPLITMLSNEEIVDFVETKEYVTVKTNRNDFRSPILVACDGTHSRIRKLLGFRDTIQHSRWTAWRTIIQCPVESMDSVHLWMGPHLHVVTYPISHARLLNLVFIARIGTPFSDAWRVKGSIDDLHDLMTDWHPDVSRLASSIDPSHLFRWGIVPHQRASATPFANRVLLMGDAWHTILPFLAQGAALAIEDAYVFARLLTENPCSPSATIKSFHQHRYRRINQVRQLSSVLGHVYRMRQPWATFRDFLSPIASRFIQHQIFDFDATI